MLYDTDAEDLIDFAQRFADLGDAVSMQVARLVQNPEHADLNPNAIALAKERLGGLNEEIDEAIADYFAARAEERP